MARPAADADGSNVDRQLSKDASLRRTLAKLRAAGSGVAGVLASWWSADPSPTFPPSPSPPTSRRLPRPTAPTRRATSPGHSSPASGGSSPTTGATAAARLRADGEVRPAILGPVLDGSDGNAAITDTDRGRYDGDTRWDRAVGPMQFIPSTWASWGRDGNGDGTLDPENIFDAALAAGRLPLRLRR